MSINEVNRVQAMPGMTLSQIQSVLHATYIGSEEKLSMSATNVTMDSRMVTEGSVFFAIRGERVDGHSFVADVMAKNALVAIVEKEIEGVDGQLIVSDSVKALQELAAYYRTCLLTKVVTITGSVGKTSTKEMIAAVLATKYRVLKTIGNYNNEIGLPLTVFRIREEDEVAVLEAGIDEIGEMDVIAKAAGPNVCVLTNIGICHLENLGSREGIFYEKTKCFDYMREGGIAVLNGDNDLLGMVKEVHGVAPVFFGIEEVSPYTNKQVYVTDVVDLGYDGSDALLHTPMGTARIHVAIPGIHQLSNAAAAAAVGLHLGLTLEEVVEGIASARTISGRTNLIHAKNLLIVDDCYNANPASMEAGLTLLTKAKGRAIAVLGDMGELGPEECALHREVGDHAAVTAPNAMFLCGPLSKEIEAGARTNSKIAISHYDSVAELIEALQAYVQPGDTILVKASHFMQFTQIVEALQK